MMADLLGMAVAVAVCVCIADLTYLLLLAAVEFWR